MAANFCALFFAVSIKKCNFAPDFEKLVFRDLTERLRKIGRVIECAGLEIQYTPFGYRGFESLIFRLQGKIGEDSVST